MGGKYGAGQDAYCYPNSKVLINKLGMTDAQTLEAAEVELSQARIEDFNPDFADFSLAALRKIHFHLYQDVYGWAGELRMVDISKGSTRFATCSRIAPEADKLFRQLQQEGCLVGLPRTQFLGRLAHYYSELNVIHPFRDGNGRAQRLMFELIAINAGFEIRWEPIARDEWIQANVAAYHCRLDLLKDLLDRTLTAI